MNREKAQQRTLKQVLIVVLVVGGTFALCGLIGILAGCTAAPTPEPPAWAPPGTTVAAPTEAKDTEMSFPIILGTDVKAARVSLTTKAMINMIENAKVVKDGVELAQALPLQVEAGEFIITPLNPDEQVTVQFAPRPAQAMSLTLEIAGESQ